MDKDQSKRSSQTENIERDSKPESPHEMTLENVGDNEEGDKEQHA